MVTHDMPGARRHVDHVVLINRFIRGVGAPDEMLSDAKLAELAVSSTEQSVYDMAADKASSFTVAQG